MSEKRKLKYKSGDIVMVEGSFGAGNDFLWPAEVTLVEDDEEPLATCMHHR